MYTVASFSFSVLDVSVLVAYDCQLHDDGPGNSMGRQRNCN